MTDKELLLLNNIMYLKPEMFNEDMEGLTIGTILDSIDSNDLGNDLTPAEDWNNIIEGMKTNEAISGATLYDFETGGGGAKMACFVTSSGEAVVAFEGTGSATEWKDNFQGGFQTDTVRQKEALDWLNELPYDNISVTGHSKGGNKAQYVTLLSDKVDHCVSYDGQGFSKEFIEEYKIQIAMNRDKITSYAADNDFANILLNDISGEKIYLEGNNVDKFVDNHCPDTVFFTDENGQLQIHPTEQSETMERMEGFCNYVLNSTSDAEREDMLSLLGDMSQILTDNREDKIDQMLDFMLQEGNEDTAGLLLAYIYRYEKESEGITDTIRDVLCSIEGTKDKVWALDLVDYLLEQDIVEWTLEGIVSLEWLTLPAIMMFTGLDKDQAESVLHMLQIMFEKEGTLLYSEDMTKPYEFDTNGNGTSSGFSINLAAAGQEAEAMAAMCTQLKRMGESIEDIRNGMNTLDSRSFRRIANVLRELREIIGEEEMVLSDMSEVLKGAADLYKRTEKRITAYR